MFHEKRMTVRICPGNLTEGSLAEKPARASLFANVTREMRNDTILLCDSLNYIKGFRYQMYCAAREATLRVCTVRFSTSSADVDTRRGSTRQV